MKKSLLFSAVMLLFIGTLAMTAAPDPDGQAARKPLSINLEIYGGFIANQPDDLNLLADYYNSYPLFFFNGQYDYLHAQYGGYFTYATSRSGDDRLQTVRNGLPCGVRLRYALSHTLSLFMSLEYLKENRLSSTQINYQIDDRSQGPIQTTPREVEADYSDFFLGVSAWTPQVGIHLAKPLGKGWHVGGSMSAGPLLARCRSVVETRTKYLYNDGYWSERFYLLEMKGTATGIALDVNAELRRQLSRRWSFFMTAGYAWHRADRVTGSGRDQSLSRDSNATQDLVENFWNGRWRKKDVFYQRNWGQFSETYYGNYFSASEADGDFALDLSGFQVKAGFAWAF